ncbi:MAG: hypothetical protein ACLT6C_00170 [Faecalibacillus intestinalis]
MSSFIILGVLLSGCGSQKEELIPHQILLILQYGPIITESN